MTAEALMHGCQERFFLLGIPVACKPFRTVISIVIVANRKSPESLRIIPPGNPITSRKGRRAERHQCMSTWTRLPRWYRNLPSPLRNSATWGDREVDAQAARTIAKAVVGVTSRILPYQQVRDAH